MTNKIEISRELAMDLMLATDSMGLALADELRALLAAPVVERQDDMLDVSAERNAMQRQRDLAAAQLRRECEDLDAVLVLFGVAPDDVRTDGGALNLPKLRILIDKPVVERQEPVVIDLDAVDWETIQQAADESNWMPNEYMRNDWIADVCNFLKYGRAEQPAPAAVAPDLSELREYHAKAVGNLKSYADDAGLRDSDVKHYFKRAAFHSAMVALIDKVKELNQ